MEIEGTVVEIGTLDGVDAPGIRIERGDDIIELAFLRRDDIQAMPNVLYKRVRITVELIDTRTTDHGGAGWVNP